MSQATAQVLEFPAQTKVCGHCRVELPVAVFARSSGTKSGLRSWCRLCEAKYGKDRRAARPGYNRYETHDDEAPEIAGLARVCTRCRIEKPLTDYHKSAGFKFGRLNVCKPCAAARTAEANEQNAERNQLKRRTAKYGITPDAFHALFDAQGGRCAVCKGNLERSSRHTCVDHSHRTGKVRGILCRQCNSGLGALQDSVALLDAAKAYLISHDGVS
jgi:Autographiviridae endonuclease VII